MDPRRNRFSPYEMRGGGPSQRQSGYVQGPPPAAHPPPPVAAMGGANGPSPSPFQRTETSNADFQKDGDFARASAPRYTGAGGPMMRPKGSFIGNRNYYGNEGRQPYSDTSEIDRRSSSRWDGGRYNDGKI